MDTKHIFKLCKALVPTFAVNLNVLSKGQEKVLHKLEFDHNFLKRYNVIANCLSHVIHDCQILQKLTAINVKFITLVLQE